MSCFVSVHLCSSAAFVIILKGNKNLLYQCSWGDGVYLNKPINPEEGVTHLLRHSAALHMAGEACPHGAKPGGYVCLPLVFIWAHFHFFLSPVSWTPGCLIQQQRGRSSRAGWCGLSVEHEVQEGYTGVRLPLSGTQSPSAGFAHTSPRIEVWSSANQPLFAHPSLSSSSCVLTPLTLLPSCALWVHHTGIQLHHIYPQTHVHEAPEKTCGAGLESKHCNRIKCVGLGWLSCASKQGPCVQTS